MADFIFIGGSEGRRSDWNGCAEFLQASGHSSKTFGWDELPWELGIEGVIGYLADELRCFREPILVGHSAGGLLLPRLTNRVSVCAEVYLAALAPISGMNFFEQMFESREEIFDPDWLTRQYESGSAKAAILAQLYEDRFVAYTEVPRVYLICMEDEEIRPEWQELIAIQVLRAKVGRLHAGHYVHREFPKEVCEMILSCLKSG